MFNSEVDLICLRIKLTYDAALLCPNAMFYLYVSYDVYVALQETRLQGTRRALPGCLKCIRRSPLHIHARMGGRPSSDLHVSCSYGIATDPILKLLTNTFWSPNLSAAFDLISFSGGLLGIVESNPSHRSVRGD